MFTSGFDEENKTKPEIVRRIESTDEGQTADQAAQALYKGHFEFSSSFLCSSTQKFLGIVNGHAHITGDLITALFSASTRGAVRRHNWFLEGLYDFIAYVRQEPSFFRAIF